MSKQYKLVIFDLDGTLTPQRDSSADPFEDRFLPGVQEKIAELQKNNIQIAIASNQLAVGRGEVPAATPLLFLRWVEEELGIDDIMVRWAPYEFRAKPDPTMLVEAIRLAYCEPEGTLMIGDDEVDRLAAEAAGVDFQWADDYFHRRPKTYHMAKAWTRECRKAIDEIKPLECISCHKWAQHEADDRGIDPEELTPASMVGHLQAKMSNLRFCTEKLVEALEELKILEELETAS